MHFTSSGDQLYAELREVSAPSPTTALPLVLLHPTPLHHHFWDGVAAELTEYRLLLPDLRAHGRSPLGRAPFASGSAVLTIEQLARDILALLDLLGIDRAVFAGCSIGGYTLYELWRIAPERIAGLVFIASRPASDTPAERARRDHWIALHAGSHSNQPGPAPEFLEAMLGSLFSRETQQEQPALLTAARAMMEQVLPGSIQAIQRGLAERPDQRQLARTISIPSVVIAGDQDLSSTPAQLAELHQTLSAAGSRSEYHKLTRAGHYAPMEQPAIVAAILRNFCRTLVA